MIIIIITIIIIISNIIILQVGPHFSMSPFSPNFAARWNGILTCLVVCCACLGAWTWPPVLVQPAAGAAVGAAVRGVPFCLADFSMILFDIFRFFHIFIGFDWFSLIFHWLSEILTDFLWLVDFKWFSLSSSIFIVCQRVSDDFHCCLWSPSCGPFRKPSCQAARLTGLPCWHGVKATWNWVFNDVLYSFNDFQQVCYTFSIILYRFHGFSVIFTNCL